MSNQFAANHPLDRWQLAAESASSSQAGVMEQPGAGGGAVAFDLAGRGFSRGYSPGDEHIEAVAVWQIDLPADVRAAHAVLAQNEAVLSASELALECTIPSLVEAFTQKVQANSFGALRSAMAGEAEISFSAAAGTGRLDTPVERDLMRWLVEIEPHLGASSQAVNQPSETGEGISYGLEGEASERTSFAEQRQLKVEFHAAVERVLQLVTHFAWLETRSEGTLLGRTIVDWSGDTDTVLGAALTQEQTALHQRSTALALASRAALLKKIVTAMQAAATLSVILTTPGGAILALPAAWRLVSQILAEIQ